jgi:hypothetical protein
LGSFTPQDIKHPAKSVSINMGIDPDALASAKINLHQPAFPRWGPR